MEGHVQFMKRYTDPKVNKDFLHPGTNKGFLNTRMDIVFMHVSRLLREELFGRLEWKLFYGTVSEYKALSSKILTEEGMPKEEFTGMEGHARFVERSDDSKMHRVFNNVLVVLGEKLFDQLGWKLFYGTVSEYRALSSKILTEEGMPKEEFIGVEGHARFVERSDDSRMHRAFNNVFAVLGEELFNQLKWQPFHGTVSEYKALRSKILTEEGELKEEYRGMEGCALFAKRYVEFSMDRAFEKVSGILDEELFEKLEWKRFRGTVHQFHELIEDFVENYPYLYEGLENQKRVADKIFKGNTRQLY